MRVIIAMTAHGAHRTGWESNSGVVWLRRKFAPCHDSRPSIGAPSKPCLWRQASTSFVRRAAILLTSRQAQHGPWLFPCVIG